MAFCHHLQSTGNAGSGQWNAALSILARMGTDVVAIQEIDDTFEALQFPSFAAAAGYPHQAVSNVSGTLSGDLRNGVTSSR